ncbi:uncharacterized protein M6B38_151320 [Iris pallida]|uniref:Polyadenylate-binding protein 2 n=1 Tax=Iris pallida TaxID=29817 RepID=A0AAX6F651_IRIPA|nr:uncharacterized protein M6B38_151320 [Iris pallida]
MEAEEHEFYGGEIPDEDAYTNTDVDMTRASDADAVKLQELDEMKKRLKEMEEEAAALREMQAKVEKEMGAGQGLFPLIYSFRVSKSIIGFFCFLHVAVRIRLINLMVVQNLLIRVWSCLMLVYFWRIKGLDATR